MNKKYAGLDIQAWFDGKDINEAAFCREFLSKNKLIYIKKIIIHAPDKSSGKRRQKVEIIFNFVDEVEIPVLAEPMIAESTLGRKKTA